MLRYSFRDYGSAAKALTELRLTRPAILGSPHMRVDFARSHDPSSPLGRGNVVLSGPAPAQRPTGGSSGSNRLPKGSKTIPSIVPEVKQHKPTTNAQPMQKQRPTTGSEKKGHQTHKKTASTASKQHKNEKFDHNIHRSTTTEKKMMNEAYETSKLPKDEPFTPLTGSPAGLANIANDRGLDTPTLRGNEPNAAPPIDEATESCHDTVSRSIETSAEISCPTSDQSTSRPTSTNPSPQSIQGHSGDTNNSVENSNPVLTMEDHKVELARRLQKMRSEDEDKKTRSSHRTQSQPLKQVHLQPEQIEKVKSQPEEADNLKDRLEGIEKPNAGPYVLGTIGSQPYEVEKVSIQLEQIESVHSQPEDVTEIKNSLVEPSASDRVFSLDPNPETTTPGDNMEPHESHSEPLLVPSTEAPAGSESRPFYAVEDPEPSPPIPTHKKKQKKSSQGSNKQRLAKGTQKEGKGSQSSQSRGQDSCDSQSKEPVSHRNDQAEKSNFHLLQEEGSEDSLPNAKSSGPSDTAYRTTNIPPEPEMPYAVPRNLSARKVSPEYEQFVTYDRKGYQLHLLCEAQQDSRITEFSPSSESSDGTDFRTKRFFVERCWPSLHGLLRSRQG